MRVGYPCICLGREEARCQRTTVLRNATPEKLRALIGANLEGLREILCYNEERGLRLFRLGNAFIPFASHETNTLRWWEEFGWSFAGIGRWVRERGHRISFHASHFTILNSAQPEVVRAALGDVEYMGRVLEAMELGPEHKVILHLGVTTPSVPEAMDRLERALDRVPELYRRHLVLENDDRWYTAEQAIEMSGRVGLPVVVDVFHHACLPGNWAEMGCAELLDLVFRTWKPEDGPPKIHFSSQDPKKKPGAHAYGIDEGDLRRFLAGTREVRQDFDIMFECKGKDVAVEAVLPVLREDPRFAPMARAA